MNKYLKWTLRLLGVFIVFYIIMIIIGLYGMVIEDYYGDLQEIYYETTDNDLIINETTKEFGIVDKTWKKINLWTPEGHNDDLLDFAYKKGNKFKLKVYRLNIKPSKIKQLNYEEVIQFINKENPKLILKYQKD